MRALWIIAVAGCGQTVPPGDSGISDTGVDSRIVPQSIQCMAPGDMKTCPAGDYCVSFQGGVADCRPLSDACKETPTCACKPMLPNATCGCSDDGQGRIVVDCH